MNSFRGVLVAVILLVAPGCDRRPSIHRGLDEALKAGDTNALNQYLKTGGDVNQQIIPRFGPNAPMPLLDWAIVYGQLDAIVLLLENGADPNMPDSTGYRPLGWVRNAGPNVSRAARIQIYQLLLKAGADPNLRDTSAYKYPPLLYASLGGDIDAVKILLAAGADVNATNSLGQSPLHFAGSAEVARLLLAAGAKTNLQTIDAESAHDCAIKDKRFGVLAVLTNANVPR